MPDLEFERIELNAIPDGSMSVFHASQFETMRPFIAYLKWGDVEFAPGEDCWCTLSIRKPDDTLVIIDQMDIDNNEVSCILTQQAVACPGDSFCQLKVWAESGGEDGCIACLNFILHVQPDPEAGGLTSESEINNLTEQIETITQEVIGEDYYNKTEVDGLISGVESQIPTKTSDLTNDSGYITTADLTPYAKTADLATVATTGDYDDLLNKPTIPDAQVQSDWEQPDNTKVDYIKNKPDIAAIISDALLAVMPVGTESGPIASFDTELDVPLVNVSCNVVATGGNGTPDNPVAINGYTEANITANGNTYTISFGQTVYGGVLDVTSGKLTVTHYGVDLGTLSWLYNSGLQRFYARYDDGIPSGTAYGLTALCDCYPVDTVNNYNNLPDDTMSVGSNYISGTVCAIVVHDETYTNEATFKTAMSGHYVVGELVTPVEIDLTPVMIRAIVGVNNVYSDTNGDTTVQYKDSIQHYIDTRV